MAKLGLQPAKTRRLLEAELRRAELEREADKLLREFQDSQTRPDAEVESVFERSLYLAPWRDRLHIAHDLDLEAGRYGPWYGPANENAYNEAVARHNDSIEGGGLWDFNETSSEKAKVPRVERIDQQQMVKFAATHYLTPHERLVFSLFWVDLKSWRVIAKQLGVSVYTVKTFIHRIRQRAKSFL